MEADFKLQLTRVWAPCILRAPARIMSRFRCRRRPLSIAM